jgi:hypothetical protein
VAEERKATIYTNGLQVQSSYSKLDLTFANSSIWFSLTPVKDELVGEDLSKIKYTDYMQDYKINFALGSHKLAKIIVALETVFDEEAEQGLVYIEDNINPDKSFKRLTFGGKGTLQDEGFEEGWISLEAFNKKGEVDLRIDFPVTIESLKFFKSVASAEAGKKPVATVGLSPIDNILTFLRDVRMMLSVIEQGVKLAQSNDELMSPKQERKKYTSPRSRGSSDDEDDDEEDDTPSRKPAAKSKKRTVDEDDEGDTPAPTKKKTRKVASAKDLLEDEDEDE